MDVGDSRDKRYRRMRISVDVFICLRMPEDILGYVRMSISENVQFFKNIKSYLIISEEIIRDINL